MERAKSMGGTPLGSPKKVGPIPHSPKNKRIDERQHQNQQRGGKTSNPPISAPLLSGPVDDDEKTHRHRKDLNLREDERERVELYPVVHDRRKENQNRDLDQRNLPVCVRRKKGRGGGYYMR